jgi:hypothetical protein
MSNPAMCFFGETYAGVAGYLTLWERKSRRTRYFRWPWEAAQAAEAALQLSASADVYFGLGLRRNDLGPKRRGGEEDVAVIPCAWLEIDYHAPGAHTRTDLPPDADAARSLLTGLPVPSAVVHSGHGLHAYWFLRPILHLDTPEERERARRLVRGFQQTIIALAALRGWHVDGTADLARVLRVPGTLNHKTDPPKPVRVVEWRPDLRYTPEALAAFAFDFHPKLLLPCARRFLVEGAAEGARDTCLFTLAKHLRRAEVPEGLAAIALAQANALCAPPLEDRQVQKCLHSAYSGGSNGDGYTSLGCDDSIWQYWCPSREECPVHQKDRQAVQAPQVRIVRLSDVERKEARWTIYPYIPRGELTLLDGDPEAGKTWTWMALVAGLTGSETCRVPYDHTATRSATVVILTHEDDLRKTVRARLEDLGADLEKVHVVRVEGAETGVTAESIEAAISLLREVGPDLVVVDPVTLYLTGNGKLDMAAANQVRAAMQPLLGLARSLDCAVLVVRHFRKAAGRALHRGLGSIDFIATARSGLVVGFDKSGRRTLAHAKSNLAPKGPALAFELGGSPPFRWLGVVDGVSADDLTEDARQAGDRKAREEAKDYLLQVLANGPVRVDEVERHARAAGISKSALRRARSELGVRARQLPGHHPPVWVWTLPDTG